ncbi:MutS-related protein [Paraburkholderia tropica]|uniref:MutS-related protein n=1 Tax=Paraburkholderia tropica TaxID=92647 RepID=UPI002AAF2CBB|nr:DNA mismatch repair protein MutS [Paraburkholderia tropica]
MAFHSILFETPEDGPPSGEVDQPDFFGDLNLDQFVYEATRGYDEYRLVPFFRTELTREGAIVYRHEVMQDLDNADVLLSIQAFALAMRKMRASLEQAEKLYYRRQKEWWFHEAASQYSQAVRAFSAGLRDGNPASSGLRGLDDWLQSYIGSEAFASLERDLKEVRTALAVVRYCIHLNGNAVTVLNYDGEPDYSAHVLGIFDRFKQGEVRDRRVEQRDYPEMNHVEAKILDLVAELHPESFEPLETFRTRHAEYLDPTVAAFDREIQFYLAYRSYIQPCRDAGLPFDYPTVSSSSKAVQCENTFDVVLAHKLCADKVAVVCNDMRLEGAERIFVVSGPNNGGKTTFARTFGQLHYLAKLGCPVPGRNSHLFLYDKLFAHFEREENTLDLRGKLQDDLMRMHEILQRATSGSIILMNEIFSSTTLADALFLCRRIIGEIIKLDALCVCVTFIEELATLGPQTVSMVSEINPDNPSARTFRVKRRPADGRAYAISVAEQYGLTYDRLKERLAS